MIQKMKNRKGFTLIEMLVVIAIIAVLVAIIVPVVGNSTTKAKAAADAANLRSVASTVAVDVLDNNKIDDAIQSVTAKSADVGSLKVYLTTAGNVEAYFTDGTSAWYGVDYFAKVAETGKATDAASLKKTASPGTELKQNTDISTIY